MIALVVGAGINGVTAAIELKKRGHKVTLIDPGPIPHPLAASTDISKAVRAAYGTDEVYTALAERAINGWREWNNQFQTQLYHETGSLFLCRREMKAGDFEYDSLETLKRRGHRVERMNADKVRKRFPAWNAKLYGDGFFESEAGYAESAHVVARLAQMAVSLGVIVRQNAAFSHLLETGPRVKGIVLHNGHRIKADTVVIAMGAWTPFALPFLRGNFRTTAQPIFHLRPAEPELFAAERFPFFGADISRTGYYGFPLNSDGVVKIANHGPGRAMSPETADRAVTDEEIVALRSFLTTAFPALSNAPIVHSHVCLYCDTLDGHFWIAPDPKRRGLVVAAGDNGHGFKFAPVLGEIIADAVEEKSNPVQEKFRWREVAGAATRKEAARYYPEAPL